MRARIYLWLSLLTFCCCCCCRWILLLNHSAKWGSRVAPLFMPLCFLFCVPHYAGDTEWCFCFCPSPWAFPLCLPW